MNLITIIGLLAAVCSSISFLPQVIKSWKTRKTQDISLPMYIIVIIGISLWLIYGFLINNLPIILANGIALILVLFVLFLKIRYG